MTWSRVILLGWIIFTLAVAGIYARALHGMTNVFLGHILISVHSTVAVHWDEKSGGYDIRSLSWNEWNETAWSASPNDRRALHWDRLNWGSFRSDGSILRTRGFINFPPWFPYLVFSALLWPLYARAREREAKLREEAHGAAPD